MFGRQASKGEQEIGCYELVLNGWYINAVCQMISYLSQDAWINEKKVSLPVCVAASSFALFHLITWTGKDHRGRCFPWKAGGRTQQSTVLCSKVSAGQSCEKCSISFSNTIHFIEVFAWHHREVLGERRTVAKLIQYQASCQMLQVALSQNRSSRESYKWCLQERLSRWIWTSLWRRGAILQNIWRWKTQYAEENLKYLSQFPVSTRLALLGSRSSSKRSNHWQV